MCVCVCVCVKMYTGLYSEVSCLDLFAYCSFVFILCVLFSMLLCVVLVVFSVVVVLVFWGFFKYTSHTYNLYTHLQFGV